MAPKIYLLLFGWLTYSVANELVRVQNEIENNISIQTKNADCINKIVSKYFNCGSNIKLFSSNDVFSYLYTNIKSGNCYNVGYKHSHEWIWTYDGYVVYVTNTTTLFETIKRIRRDKRWNPRAKYIVKAIDTLNELEEIDIFNTFLDLNIFDVVLLKDKNDAIEILTYFSFGNGSCGNSVVNITSFGNCNDSSKVNLFPNKLDTWSNCSVTVAVSEDPPFVISKNNRDFKFLDTIEGLEQFMLSNIGKRENISINYIVVPQRVRYGVVLQNGSYTGSLVYLQNKTADIVAGAFILIKNRAEVFDVIFGYSYPTIKIYTSALREETWKNIHKPFGKTTWFLIVLTYIVFSTVMIVVSYLITGNDDYVKIMLQVLGYFYGNVNNNLIRVTKLRKFMIIWIVFTLLICSFYNTAFYSVLTGKKRNITPIYDKQYLSFLTPCITETVLTFFKYTHNETLVTDSSPNCRYIENALDNVAESRNLYTFYFDYSYKFAEYKYINKDGNKKLDTWAYASNFIVTMYTSKGFPFLDLFRKYINNFFESGLTEKHLNDIYFKSQLLKTNPVRKFKPVTLSDYRVHFGLLLFGTVLSTICFVVELNQRKLIM